MASKSSWTCFRGGSLILPSFCQWPPGCPRQTALLHIGTARRDLCARNALPPNFLFSLSAQASSSEGHVFRRPVSLATKLAFTVLSTSCPALCHHTGRLSSRPFYQRFIPRARRPRSCKCLFSPVCFQLRCENDKPQHWTASAECAQRKQLAVRAL